MHRCAKAPLITGQQWARIIFLDNIIMKTAPGPETSPPPRVASITGVGRRGRGVMRSRRWVSGRWAIVGGRNGGVGKSVCEVNSSRIQYTVFFCGSRGRLSRYFFWSFSSIPTPPPTTRHLSFLLPHEVPSARRIQYNTRIIIIIYSIGLLLYDYSFPSAVGIMCTETDGTRRYKSSPGHLESSARSFAIITYDDYTASH